MSPLSAAAWQRRWYAGPPLVYLRPLSAVYARAVRLRRWLYRRGVLRVVRFAVPVVVVGNLTVGGTGKTPFVIWLARLLAVHGWRPAVLLRGYGGRMAAAPLRVHADSDPALCGDEAVLIAAEALVPVYVCPRRVSAARVAVEEGADVLLCDDGLQHYALGRDLEIVMLDGARRLGNGALLPAGPLREPPTRLVEAGFVVTKLGSAQPGEVMMDFAPPVVRALRGGEASALSDWAGREVHAVAGIADPENFFRMLRAAGLRVRPHPLPDHAPPKPGMFEFGDTLPVLMTGKDAVKCRHFANSRLYRVGFDAVLDAVFTGRLLACMEGFANGRKTAA